MTTPSKPQPFPLGLTVAALIAFCLLIGLGLWQLQRRAWKEALLARIDALATAPAQPLGAALANVDPDMMRIETHCLGLAKAPYLELYAVRDGQAGVRLISFCRRADGGAPGVLVDRGFIPDSVKARPAVDPAARDDNLLKAVVRVPEKPSFMAPANPASARGAWYRRDIAAMSKALGAPATAAFFLASEVSNNPELPALVAAPLPKEIANRHLEYALTWFALAVALAGMYVARVWKKR